MGAGHTMDQMCIFRAQGMSVARKTACAVLTSEGRACQVDGRHDPALLEGDATTRALMMTDTVGDKVGYSNSHLICAFQVCVMAARASQQSGRH